jgi:hypothetical protein
MTVPLPAAGDTNWTDWAQYIHNAVQGGGSAGASTKSLEDAARAVYAKGPSAESGLTALAVDGSTDDAARIQAMLNYLKAAYNGGKLILPPGRSIVNSGITLPDGVQVVGSEMSVWDFWFASDGMTALTFTGSDQTPIRGLKIQANQYDSNTGQANTTTKVGLRVSGNHLTFEDLYVFGFNVGIDLTQDDTYIIAFDRARINNCMVGVNADLGAVYATGTANSNSGERISFTNSLIANCGTGFWASASGCGLHFTNTSMDFINLFGRIQDAHVFFTNCHIETQGVPVTPTNVGGTRLPYLFDLNAAARLTVIGTNFIIGRTGVSSVINNAVAPPGLWGMAFFSGCHIYYTPPAGVTATRAEFSEQIIPVPQGATTVTVSSLLINRWSPVRAATVAYNGSAQVATTARVTAMNFTNSTVTITMSVAAPANTYIEVDF